MARTLYPYQPVPASRGTPGYSGGVVADAQADPAPVATPTLVTTAALAALQPLDADLTDVAALSTTAFGRARLADANAAASRTALGLGTAAQSATGDFAATAHAHAATRNLEFIIDGGGAVITTGVKGDIEVSFAGTITAWRVLADQSGAIAVGVWKDNYANFPPVVGDVIAVPTIAASGLKAEATGLSIAIAAGDILRFNVNSVAAIQRATVSLTVAL